MTKHPLTNVICWLLATAMLALTVGFMNGEALGLETLRGDGGAAAAYESFFDDTVVHTVDLVVSESDWAALQADAAEKEYYACSVVIDGTAVKNAAVRTKGNTSLTQVTNGRYSLKIEFDHYEEGKSYQGLDKLALNNIIQDDTYLKDWLCYTLFRQMGVPSPLCSFAVVTVNGEYYGLCLAVEVLEEAFLQRNYGVDYGDLYKPDSAEGGSDGSASLAYTTDDPSDYSDILSTAKTDVTAEDEKELIAALKALGEGDAASALDVEEVLRYFVVHNFVVSGDGYTGSMLHNYYLYQKDGKLAMLPWDYNLAFGSFSMGGGAGGGGGASSAVNWPLDDPLLSGSLEDRPMLAWIFSDEAYTEQYHQLMDEFLTTCFDSGWFAEAFDQMAALISPYVEADTTSFTDYDSFQSAAADLRTFCLLRAQSLRGQLDGTIPSTSAGQAADSSALVDAGGLSISAMGGAGGGAREAMGEWTGRLSWTAESGPPDQRQEEGELPGGSPAGEEALPEDGGQGERPALPEGESPQGAFPASPEGDVPQNGEAAPSDEDMPQFAPSDGASPQDGEVDRGEQAFAPQGGNQAGGGRDMSGGFGGRGGEPGGMWEEETSGAGSGLTALALTGSAVLVLLAGLLFAWKYPRR